MAGFIIILNSGLPKMMCEITSIFVQLLPTYFLEGSLFRAMYDLENVKYMCRP